MKLSEPAIFLSRSLSRVLTILCAPSFIASSRLESLEVKAVTSHPTCSGNASARWPRPANPDHANPVGRFHVILHDGIEDRDAAAEKRTGFFIVECFGQRLGPDPMGTHTISETTVAMHDGRFARSESLHRLWSPDRQLAARHATAREPAEADALPDLAVSHVFADRLDFADDFMTGNEGYSVMPHSLFSIDKSEWQTPQITPRRSPPGRRRGFPDRIQTA